MKIRSLLALSVLCVFAFAWLAEAQNNVAPPAEVKLTTRYSLDAAAIWAEMPQPARNKDFKRQQQELEQGIALASGPLDKAQAHLALANWHLAVPTTTPATKWLLHMASDKDLERLADAAEKASGQIKEARLLLKKVPTTTSAPSDLDFKPADFERRKKLDMAAETLDSFKAALASAVVKGDEPTRKNIRNQAARSLARVREAASEDVAACALMWQAFIWNLAGRDGRSIITLPNVTVKPERPDYDFICRLLRCRIIMENGQYAAALALGGRIRSSCAEWFAKESADQVRSRERLAALVQCQVGNEWMRRLREDHFLPNADRLEALLLQVQQQEFPKDRKPVVIYTLERSVPLLVGPPEGGASSKPAVMPSAGSKPESASAPGPG